MDLSTLVMWLRETDTTRLAELWREADRVRGQYVGDAVHLRGLIEFSNYCVRQCAYCGLRASNRAIHRYRMSTQEILLSAHQAASFGYGTVVLQSGEDLGFEPSWLAEVIQTIKRETALAVTLSVGERSRAELEAWREAGADRYLLRFETSNRRLYEQIHPPRSGQHRSDRLAMLEVLRDVGYEVGSGVMIGIPGQTYDDLARDVMLFKQLDLDMVGSGPYVPHPNTPAGRGSLDEFISEGEHVPASELMAYKVIALTRLVCPHANIPSTTALATLNSESGRELGLARGANVVMPNVSPPRYRTWYEIYPGKACIQETAEHCNACIHRRINKMGRVVGTGRGDSPNYTRRHRRSGARFLPT